MKKLTHSDLYKLEDYQQQRIQFRKHIIEHKKKLRIQLGNSIIINFEDRLTIQYQIQEMLRAEKIFTADEIQAELDVYNPLIPDGDNLKAVIMICYSDTERTAALKQLIDIEHKFWLQLNQHKPVYATADEDLPRSTHEKTSAVHFIRFQLTHDMLKNINDQTSLTLGCSHPAYNIKQEITNPTKLQLLSYLDG